MHACRAYVRDVCPYSLTGRSGTEDKCSIYRKKEAYKLTRQIILPI